MEVSSSEDGDFLRTFSTKICLFLLLSLSSLSSQKVSGDERADINFALKEGHTIVGVMDHTRAMRFYIGSDLMDEKTYE